MNYAEVYLYIKTLEVDHPFDYRIPHELYKNIVIGSVVAVPFGTRKEIGCVSKIKYCSNISDKEIKSIEKIISTIPVFDSEKLRLIHWMSKYYVAPPGKVIEFFLPPGTKKEIEKRLGSPEKFFRYSSTVYLNHKNFSPFSNKINWKRNYSQKRILDFLLKNNKADLKELLKSTESSSFSLKSLLNKGILYIEKHRTVDDDGINDFYNIKKEIPNISISESKLLCDEVLNCSINKKFKGFLLQEFSNSEQFRIYVELSSSVMNYNKRVIILTPEKNTAEKIYSNFPHRLKKKVCVYHSEMSDSSRLEKWYNIFFSKYDIAVGTRSSIFLPFNNLGLIIICEEGDPSYKESTMVRYNAPDVALRLGKILKIPVVFGSIAPSVKTRYFSENNKDFGIIKHPVSYYDRSLVKKIVIDLKKIDKFKEDINITNTLYREINEEITKKNKVVIFMNRRGFSSYLICKNCGNIPRCPDCNISYSYHKKDNKLVCHHCSKSEDFNGLCSYCGNKNFTFRGTGIEKIESKLLQRFGHVPIFRLDSDEVKRKKNLRHVLFNFKTENPVLLIGTQMLAREVELENIKLAAVIDFDSMFYLPDFYNSERAFLLLNQLLSILENTVESRFIIQAYNTNNNVLLSFTGKGYDEFYSRELLNRKALLYPPFSSLINIIVSGRIEKSVICDIEKLEEEINKKIKVNYLVLGPSRAPFYKINRYYRWHILIKNNSYLRFNVRLAEILKNFKRNKDNKIIVDVDPVWIL